MDQIIQDVINKINERQWVCLNCGHINFHDDKKCRICPSVFDGSQPTTKDERMLIVYDKNNIPHQILLMPQHSYNFVEIGQGFRRWIDGGEKSF